VQEAQRTAKTARGLELRERARKVERVHQNAQRLLNLIEAVAFLHQQQRVHKRLSSGVDYIEATVEDYAIAYAIASSVLGSGLDELRKPARDLLAVIESKLHELAETRGTQPSGVSFQRRDVRAWSGLPNHQVKLAMHELEELEYVEVERSTRGSRFTYRLMVEADRKRTPLAGLMTPVELYNRVNAQPVQRPDGGMRRPIDGGKVERSGKAARSTRS